MTVELRRVVSQPPVTGTPLDPLYVIVQGISLTKFFKEASTLGIAPLTETTLITQVFTATTFENLVIAAVSGTNYAKYKLKVNGTTVWTKRTGPDLNKDFDYTGAPYELGPGDVVTVTVEHFNAGNEDFDASLFGYGA